MSNLINFLEAKIERDPLIEEIEKLGEIFIQAYPGHSVTLVHAAAIKCLFKRKLQQISEDNWWDAEGVDVILWQTHWTEHITKAELDKAVKFPLGIMVRMHLWTGAFLPICFADGLMANMANFPTSTLRLYHTDPLRLLSNFEDEPEERNEFFNFLKDPELNEHDWPEFFCQLIKDHPKIEKEPLRYPIERLNIFVYNKLQEIIDSNLLFFTKGVWYSYDQESTEMTKELFPLLVSDDEEDEEDDEEEDGDEEYSTWVDQDFFQELLEYEKEEFRKFDYESFVSMMGVMEEEEKD